MIDPHRRVIVLAGIVTLVIASAILAHAQTSNLNVKLGLWEGTTTTNATGMPAIDLDKMNLTPEQRARAEAAMKMNPLAPGHPPVVRHECITQEKLNKPLFHADDKDCKRTVVSSSPTLQEIKMECNGRQPSSGTLRIEAMSPEDVKVTAHMTVGQEGEAMTIDSTTVGKWVASSCGDVK
jgi:hypothetical protein